MRNILTIILFVVAATAVAHDDYVHRRDSVLSLITGAQLQDGYIIYIDRLGARGDGKKDCRPAIDRALRQAERRGGARIVVPRGTWLVRGPIHLKSNVTIELQEGATLRFDPTPELYLPAVATSWEGTFCWNLSPFIYGRGLHDVAIVGSGTIDGNAASTFATWRPDQKAAQMRSRQQNHDGIGVDQRRYGVSDRLRPQFIQFYDCERITIDGVKLINSPFWCIHLLRSENIVCRGIRYDAKLINNDGIDPDCSRNVLIEDVHFDNGDDNVAIKAARDRDGWDTSLGRTTSGIVIRRCHFKGLHAVVIGSEMSAGVEDVYVDSCDYAGYVKRGLYVKTNPNRGGFVRHIYVRDCQFDEVEDLLYVTSRYAGEGLDDTHFTAIGDIHIDGLAARRVAQTAIALQGTAAEPLRHVTLRRVTVDSIASAGGLSMEHTDDVVVRDCRIGPAVGTPTLVTAKDKLFDR